MFTVVREGRRSQGSLSGVGVLITRPVHQAQHLSELIEAAGGVAIRFPTIDIVPPEDPAAFLNVLDRLSDYDLAIFVSANAVEQTFNWMRAAKREWPKDLPVACVGRATAATARTHGLDAIVPTERFDSEALLGLSLLQDVANRKVVIFRGVGGRELLGNTLAHRGATVTYAECYRRQVPRADIEPLINAWRQGEIQIVCVTSTDGLHNLHDMLGETGRGWLYDTPLVMLSQAQAAASRELGCTADVIVATEASDEAILEAVKTWRREHSSL